MDGVLIDSEELHAHAKRIAFAHEGIALTHADLRAYVGRSDAIMIDEIGVRYELTNHQRSIVLHEKTRIYEQEEKGIKIVRVRLSSSGGRLSIIVWLLLHRRRRGIEPRLWTVLA
jgi:beta-phosphoglucomutase-like phosphatase (HAD superfamily)